LTTSIPASTCRWTHVRHGGAQPRGVELGRRGVALAARVDEIGRPNEAAHVGRENSLDAALHLFRSQTCKIVGSV